MTTRRIFLGQYGRTACGVMPRRQLLSRQTFPTKPIRIIVPFPPGGPADTAVRIAQPGMEKALGQPIIVENVAGAAGGSVRSGSSNRKPTAIRCCRRRARTPPTPR